MRLSVIRQIGRKELTLFFVSPIGYLFLAAFLVATLFIFFWLEAFFARNIADVRPMFEWMPVLLIFLSAALTMKMWSEERRSGTLEFVATVPASSWEFVLGKFAACWMLLLLALLLTLPLPVSVALIGDLDWGPVIAGYIAAMLLGGAYIAVGLFVSSRTDSQIVSLIIASLLCGGFYLIGSSTLVKLFGGDVAQAMSTIGSGARFESITRGVLDVRDMYFYISVLVAFLALNVYALQHERWAKDGNQSQHQIWRLATALVVFNVLFANVWLSHVTSLRVDMTQGNIYSVSDATRSYLGQLREPLLLRGYFSAKTHPLLAPLVPRMKDLLREYEIAGNGQVRVEIIDPAEDAELENEANTKYGIRAVPFQVADRYQASLVNSYFDVLVAYGSEYEVLSFRDLIEVKAQGETNIDVLLKNPEFDVTRAIKRVLYGFQGGASVFDNMNAPVRFVGYISDDSVLPEPLVELKGLLNEVLVELAQQGGDKFSSELVDPQAGDGQVALDIAAQYGFQPMAASLFDDSRFYFYLTLQNDETVVQIPIPDPLSTEALQRSVEEGLKRFASGLLKSVILNAPEPTPPFAQQQGTPPANEFNQLLNFLSSDFNVDSNDLSGGTVPADADMVVVVDPSNFDDKQVFALDQFLMKGGTVLLSSGAFAAQPTPTSLSAVQRTSGLEAWLAHHGVTIEPALVMDPQNTAFPVPVTREVGGFSFQDLVMLDYPYFIDVRDDGLAEDTPITAGLPQLTMSWASPITLNLAEGVSDTPLLQSSAGSWRSQDTNVMPRFSESGLSEFTPTSEQASQLLGVVLEGRFESYFAGRESPLLATADEPDEQAETPADDESATSETVELGVVSSVIERSPESARLVVFSSNDFLADQSLRMMGAADGTIYLNSVQLLTNLVDWTLEDQSLTSIRARGNFNRTLPSMPVESQSVVEYSNYLLALLGIGLVLVIFRARQGARRRQYQAWMEA